MIRLSLLALLATSALAAPLDERQSGPSVTIRNGTVVGSTASGIDSFKGIPFAQPPVGNLRLRSPRPLASGFGTITSDPSPRACPQFSTQVNTGNLPQDALAKLMNTPLFQEINNAGEDCLTLNVQRPSTATSSSKLPVLFWIYGGGFESGSTGMYDGGSIIRKSVSLGKPIMFVEVNYRVGGFGFLGGKDLAGEGNTNLGLRDQRLGLQWVQDNIAAFGGDPTKVTIWGESAGAISVFDHTVINGGDNTYHGQALFRGAIMNSGSEIPATSVTDLKSQKVYDTVVAAAGCSSASSQLACLRALSYEKFLNAASSVPSISSYQSLDIAYLPRPDPGNSFFSESPEVSINAGRFTKVPIIIGDQEDEGTAFSLVQSNVTTDDQLAQYLADYFPTNPNALANVRALLANYPNQPLEGQPAGSPFRTAGLNNIYPQFKRLAAVLGDITFTLTRRVYLHTVQPKGVKTWSYLSSYFHGTPVLGTFHASDLLFSFALMGDADANPITNTIQTYYVSFVNDLDPNSLGSGSGRQINWPNWTPNSAQLLNFQSLANQIISDDFRNAAYQYLLSAQTQFRIKR
ncbi:uncharacterized protein MYCFIDRAFT_57762 [Pseudocercospora fijiensis CIRAD86]|uniref:Carboxylic ester hydrolase n=1 Tax=Pseudocercospora fijiensis (strain CIRAD86) TaxID=383855 RepID=M3A3H8_PSEFD|nr:uncharacterized protein MYCFIDRAFT_57762 [Pseudocercospora fijiensis CIRAD86]EME79191.1 hypothetical protein MYCFIDRAFT_57762 [Pseudocercospora fijiensis CIRAD86]